MELLKSQGHWHHTSSCVIVTQSRAVYGQWEIICVVGCSHNYNAYWSDHFCLFCQQGVIALTLHSISLTYNHAHMLTGDKVTGPYVYACSVIVPPQTDYAMYYLLSHNVRRQQINLPPGSASFRGGAFLFCAAASRTCAKTNST